MTDIAYNLYCKMLRIAFFSDLHATRFSLGLAEFFWGFSLLWPGETFNHPCYGILSRVMAEEAWALLFLVMASLQFCVLLMGDYHSKFATRFAAISAVLWVFITFSMFLSISPPPAALSGDLALAVGAAWVFIRSGIHPAGRRDSDNCRGCHGG